MKRVMAMIASLAGAFRTVYEWCGNTGRLVGKLVCTPLIGSGTGAGMTEDEPPAVVAASAERDVMQNIRNLAGAFAADRVTGDDLEPVADNHIEWLATMCRSMLAKVLYADDQSLPAHIRGERTIRAQPKRS